MQSVKGILHVKMTCFSALPVHVSPTCIICSNMDTNCGPDSEVLTAHNLIELGGS